MVRGFAKVPIDNNQSSIDGAIGHENGMVLYRSHQSPYVLKHRYYDWIMFGLGAWVVNGFLSGTTTFMALPLIYGLCSAPRRLSQMNHFCFHAELLPHSEQVVFHKVHLFGELSRVYVDIRNLEKINAEDCGTPLLWDVNMFDSNMVFRCTESNQKFVFDKAGIWN